MASGLKWWELSLWGSKMNTLGSVVESNQLYSNTEKEILVSRYSKQLDEDGVVVIPNVFSVEQITKFDAASRKAFEEVDAVIAKSARKEMEYITAFDRIYYNRKYYYDAPDGSSIIELAKGRYDFRLNIETGVFAADEFMYPEPIP